ncbi:MAG: hypothetical protein FJ218_11125, partial [Ignavibacteria bacterium]|nr:hypothetical protein [Ignavibacteria bacterium]
METTHQKTSQSLLFAGGLILLAAFSRILPHPPNFTPVSAIALFGGVYLEKRWSILVPFVT